MEGFSLVQLAVDSTTIIRVLNPPQQGLDQGVRSLLCATARRTDKSYDSVGCWKDEPLGAQPLTSEAKENLRSIVLKGPFEPAKLRVLPSPVTGVSRSRGVPEPR